MIGTLIHERYRIDRELGQGGMGTVYKGVDTTLKRNIAIKILTETSLGTEGRNRLLQEAQAIAQLSHSNIVTVFDAGEYEKNPFIVMEYVEGVNLYEQPPKEIEEIVTITQQVCAALSHAHEHGIIHRDLKPENVILTANGTVKLMDFGLARSISSRLTSEGTILGTVFYLAPEQAQGKPIDLRSDLYSLGVMLYELATGELPFMAGDPLAVVSQHIHAPVVPPRAKNDRIPPALEALILALMHKDPAERPASAKKVQERLSAPEMLDVTALPAEELSVLDRIVRGRLVGRERELKQARQAWGQAMSGQGQLLLVSGEPGVGKTRLMREVVTQAEVSGGQAFIGESQAEGNAPYAAFAQIIRRALRAHQNNELELPDLVLAELISIAPELQIMYPEISPNPALEPESEQRRLFECIITFFSTLCGQSPLLLVLEDIHWADSGTLSLLQFLARRCREQPVMFLGTYREVELDEALPFHQTLLDLNRKNLVTRIKLERLDENNTRDMLAVIFAEGIRPDFLVSIYRETEGNPFFIEEVCKALIESGQVYFDGEIWQRPLDMADMEIPQSIKVAVQSRVSKLSESAQETLLTAAVIGREFGFELLRKVTEKQEDDLINGLEAALKAQLIEELKEGGGERFSFSHALIPATLRESLSGMRRTRMHLRVAQIMEEIMPDAYQRLAYHWGEGGDLEKGLVYIIKAAERAKEIYANEDAIRLYSEALDMLVEEDERRFDLLAARAGVYNLAGEKEAQMVDSEAMLALAHQLKDDRLVCKARLSLAEHYGVDNLAKSIEQINKILEIIDLIDEPLFQVHALILYGELQVFNRNFDKSLEVLHNADQLCKEHGLIRERARCLHTLSQAQNNSGDFEEAMISGEESLQLSRAIGDKQQELQALRCIGNAAGSLGNNEKCQLYNEKSLEISREIGDKFNELITLNNLGELHLTQPDIAAKYYLQALRISDDTGMTGGETIYAYFGFCLLPKGELEFAFQLLQEGMDSAQRKGYTSLFWAYKYAFIECLAHLGQYERLDKMIDDQFLTEVEDMHGLFYKVYFMGSKGMYHFFSTGDDDAFNWITSAIELSGATHGEGADLVVRMQYAWLKSFKNQPTDWVEGLREIDSLVVHPSLMRRNFWFYLVTKTKLYLKLGDYEKALATSTELINTVKSHYIGMREHTFLTHVQALRANGENEKADQYLAEVYERVMMVAEKTKDAALRKSWLENVPWNREILQEAKARGW